MPPKRNIQSSEPSTEAFGHNSPKKYSIWQNDNRQILFAFALLIAGLVLTCAAALYIKRGVESKAKNEFDFACGEIKNRISTRLRSHALLLRSGSAFFDSADEITRETWNNFLTRQKIERNLPGIQGIGYAIIIPPEQLALHERKIRNEGFPQYAVKPTGKREIYTSIIYLEPFSKRNQRAFGYDMFSEPIRRKAMEYARDFDDAALSGKIMLVQETDKDKQAGTLMYVPVYEKGQPIRTIEERRRAIRGWVYSPYRMNDLMRGILGAWEFDKGRSFRLEVFDDASFQSKDLLYDSSPGQKLEPTSTSIFNEQTSILFNNKSWSLRFTHIGDRTGIIDYSKVWYVLIGGTLLSVLFFVLCFLLINTVYRARALAEALTRELHESNERKKAEDMLRQQTDAMDSAIDGMAILNKDEEYVYANEAHVKMYGYDNEGEIIGKSWRILYDSDVIQRFEQEFMPEFSRKGYWFGESIGKKKNGSKFPQAISLTAMADGGLICVVRDITDRKQAESQREAALEELRKSEEYFKEITENSSDVIIIADRKGDIKYCSLSTERIIGYKPEDLIGRNIIRFIHPDDVKRAIDDFGKAILEKDSTIPNEFRILHKDGSERYVEGLGKNLLDNPTIAGYVMNVHDITERKLADKLLRKNEERYRVLVENASDIVFRTDDTGHYTFVNPATLRITGYSEEELIGKHYKILIRPDMFKEAMKVLAGQYESRVKNTYIEFPIITKDGHEVWIGQNTQLIIDGDQVIGFQAVGRDVTERKQAEEKLQQTLGILRKSIGVTIQVMVSAIEVRDPYTAGHQKRVSDLARSIATEMGLDMDKIEGIRMAGSIHDIGKLAIPSEILTKPTKLTNLEFSLIKEHSQSGYDMLKDVESPWPLAQIVYQHHERINGSGYPRKLKGDEILIEARIMAVADVVEAMASHRPYRPGLGLEAALEEIEKNKGIAYDDAVADACLKLFREKGYQLK